MSSIVVAALPERSCCMLVAAVNSRFVMATVAGKLRIHLHLDYFLSSINELSIKLKSRFNLFLKRAHTNFSPSIRSISRRLIMGLAVIPQKQGALLGAQACLLLWAFCFGCCISLIQSMMQH